MIAHRRKEAKVGCKHYRKDERFGRQIQSGGQSNGDGCDDDSCGIVGYKTAHQHSDGKQDPKDDDVVLIHKQVNQMIRNPHIGP